MAILETTTTAAAAAESAKLQRHFGRFDILFFLICTIVGVDTIASVASSGGEAFTWMVLLAVAFWTPLHHLGLHYLLTAHLLQNVILAEWAPLFAVLGVSARMATGPRVMTSAAVSVWQL